MERRARPRPRAAARARGRRTRGEALRAQGAGARRAEGGGPRVLFAAGGTGGHVYPAIAIADAVRRLDPRAEVLFAGTADRLEAEAVPAAGYRLQAVRAVRLRRPLPHPANLLVPFRVLAAVVRGLALLARFRPDCVVGTGGYVALPTCVAALLRRCPVFVQEQNARAGVANRLLGRFARAVFVAFEEAGASLGLPPGAARVYGNPLRASVLAPREAGAPAGLAGCRDRRLVVVLGGSLGAAALNAAAAGMVGDLVAGGGEGHPKVAVLWQTGPAQYEAVRARLAGLPSPAREHVHLRPYLEDMGAVYAAAALVVSRAGALTCSELLATGTPAILVPAPHVAEDHQTKNAASLVARGEAAGTARYELLPEARLGPASLLAAVRAALARGSGAGGRAEVGEGGQAEDAAARIARDVLAACR